MSIITPFIPTHYKVLRMGLQRTDSGVVAIYDIQLLNAEGQVVGTVNPASVLTTPEKAAIATIFNRDKAMFEAATGLSEWTAGGS